jgi:DNA replication protein DnaC
MDALPERAAPISIKQSEKQDVCDKHGEFTSMGFQIGRTMRWQGCPACSEAFRVAQAEEQAKEAAAAKQRNLETTLNRSGIPLRYRAKDFSTFVADTDGKEKALAAAMEFVKNIDQHADRGTVIVFSGQPGTGKSHLAIAIGQALMERGTVLYTSAIDAVRMIRDTWRRDSPKTESQVLEALSSVGLLILDEVGVQYGTEAEQVSLFDIIDKRYRDMMPMILLTNQNKAGMKSFLGDRSFDRLREGGQWVTFDWESHRGKTAP